MCVRFRIYSHFIFPDYKDCISVSCNFYWKFLRVDLDIDVHVSGGYSRERRGGHQISLISNWPFFFLFFLVRYGNSKMDNNNSLRVYIIYIVLLYFDIGMIYIVQERFKGHPRNKFELEETISMNRRYGDLKGIYIRG